MLGCRPLARVIPTFSSIASSCVCAEAADEECGATCSCVKPAEVPPSRPSRYSFLHHVRGEREIQQRRAVADPCQCPRKLFSTIRTCSASLQSRRRPRSFEERISKSDITLDHAIQHDLHSRHQSSPDGPRRSDTAFVAYQLQISLDRDRSRDGTLDLDWQRRHYPKCNMATRAATVIAVASDLPTIAFDGPCHAVRCATLTPPAGWCEGRSDG